MGRRAGEGMTIREYSNFYSRRGLPDEILYAGEFLESRGLTFLVDFGWSNAVDLASKILVDEIDRSTVWAWQTTIWIR